MLIGVWPDETHRSAQAADEFEDAVAHYDDKQAGLGQSSGTKCSRPKRTFSSPSGAAWNCSVPHMPPRWGLAES